MISHDRTRRMMYSVALVLGVAAGLGLSPSVAQQSGISVNGVQLPLDIVRQLQQIYPVPIAPGRYWYDAFSGAFGIEGGPAAFNLALCGGGGGGGTSGGSSTKTFCDANGACTSSGILGTITTAPGG